MIRGQINTSEETGRKVVADLEFGVPLETSVGLDPIETRSVAAGETRGTMGGAPCDVWPGGGITVMADVARLPKRAFGHVPTPALVAPIEFTLPRALYAQLGGHMQDIVPVARLLSGLGEQLRIEPWNPVNPWPFAPS